MVEVDEVGGGAARIIILGSLGSGLWDLAKAVAKDIAEDFKNHKTPASDDHTWHK